MSIVTYFSFLLKSDFSQVTGGGLSENPFTGWDGIELEDILSYLNVFKDFSERKINSCVYVISLEYSRCMVCLSLSIR